MLEIAWNAKKTWNFEELFFYKYIFLKYIFFNTPPPPEFCLTPPPPPIFFLNVGNSMKLLENMKFWRKKIQILFF